jgi:hypothetical protein
MWSLITTFFAIGAVGGLGLFALSKTFAHQKRTALLLTSLFLTAIIFFMITAQPERWIYFLPIPFLLCFNIFLGSLFSDVNYAKKTTIAIFTILYIITIAVNSNGLAYFHFTDSAQPFYQFIGNEEIQALNWIKNVNNTNPTDVFATSGHVNDVGGGGNSYAWWVEGYANRVCMFTGDLQYFSYQFERDNVNITNRIFAGTYGVEYGNLRVTEASPAGTSNPQIDTYIKDDYEHLITINDNQNQLFYTPDGSDQTMATSPFYTENGTSTVASDDSVANITVTYEQTNFELSRSVVVGPEQDAVDVYFHALPINCTLTTFKINLWTMFDTTPQNCNVDANGAVNLIQELPSGNVTTKITVVDTNGELNNTRVIFDNLQKGKPVVSYLFDPQQSDLVVHLRVSIDSPTPKPTNPTVKVYDCYSLIKELKIDYIMINKYRVDEYQRFLYDSAHFTTVFQNDNVAILKVNPT